MASAGPVKSSSTMVSVCMPGGWTGAASTSEAATDTSRSGPSTASSTAVMVTVPELAVLPAPMVRTRFELRTNWSAVAGATGWADTLRETS